MVEGTVEGTVEGDDVLAFKYHGLFFVSPASDFITGQILYVDGGLTATQ